MPSEALELPVHMLPIYFLNVNQVSLEGAKRSAAQMLVTRAVSDAPVAALCQAFQPLKTDLNKANRSQSLPI